MPRMAAWGMIWPMPNTESQGKEENRNYARFIHVGFAFMLTIAAFTAGGYGLDVLTGTLPLFMLLGMLVGFVAALYYLFKTLGNVGDG